MKKLIALLMVIAMAACLFVGCDKNDKQGSDAPQGDGDVGTTQNGGTDSSVRSLFTGKHRLEEKSRIFCWL